MFQYEIHKLFFNKGLLLGIVFLLLFNGANIFKQHYPTMEGEPVYVVCLKIYQELKGRDIEESLQIMKKKQENIAQLPEEKIELYSAVYEEILNELNEMKGCKGAGRELRDKSYKKAEAYREQNTYLFQINSKIAELYSEREIREFHNVSKITEFINYKFSYILIIFLIILGGLEIFVYDKESGAWQVMKTTRNGRKKIAGIKIIVMQLYVIMLAVIFGACNFLCFKLCYGFEGIGQPMYAIPEYKYMPVNDMIAVFLIKNFVFGLLGLSVMAALVMLLSVIFKERKIVFLFSLVMVLVLMFYRTFAYLGNGKLINLLNPIHCFLSEKIMLYYENIWLFGRIVPDSVIVIIAAIGLNVLFSGMLLFLYGKKLNLAFCFPFFRKKKTIRIQSEDIGGGENRNV